MSVSERTKNRNKIKRLIVKLKTDVVAKAKEIEKTQGVAMAQITSLLNSVGELAGRQMELNALSAPIDEKALLEQSMNRTIKSE